MTLTNNPDARLIELRTEIETANVAFGNASNDYCNAFFEARANAKMVGEPVQPWTGGTGNESTIDEQALISRWGICDKYRAYSQASARCDELMQELSDTPAQTIDGILAKLEVWQIMDVSAVDREETPLDGFVMYGNRMAISALRDARDIASNSI